MDSGSVIGVRILMVWCVIDKLWVKSIPYLGTGPIYANPVSLYGVARWGLYDLILYSVSNMGSAGRPVFPIKLILGLLISGSEASLVKYSGQSASALLDTIELVRVKLNFGVTMGVNGLSSISMSGSIPTSKLRALF